MSEQEFRFSEWVHWTDKQRLANAASRAHRFTLFGGARGPGKSYWLRWWCLARVLERRGMGIENPVVGLFCEDYPTLRDRQIVKMASEFPRVLGEVRATQEAGLGFHLHHGGMIALRNLDDPSKYRSAEFCDIGWDEVTRGTKETFDILRGSLRWEGLGRCRFAGATNPGDVGHLWVKDLWVDGIFPAEMESLRPEFAFVRALPDDNPHLTSAYWSDLDTLPPDLARAWRWGEWDVFAGQVFSEWRRDLHVVEPFEIPVEWIRWRAIDWGYASPLCCLWLARDPNSWLTVVYRELYQAGLTDPEQAERIRELSGGERIEATLADPSMWTVRSLERQTVTSADVYERGGVRLTKADNDRLIGLRRVRDALRDGEPMDDEGEARPGLLVFSTCANLIRTLPALPYDRVRVEDVDSSAEDHAYDALRYGMSFRVPRRTPPPAGNSPWRHLDRQRARTRWERLERMRR